MRQAVIAVLLILLLSFIFSGGFSVSNQAQPIPSSPPRVGTLLGEGDPTDNDRALQLRTLKFTNLPQPSASVTPSTPPASAAPSTPPSCGSQPVAVDFLLDVSSTMNQVDSSGTSKIAALKSAIVSFGNRLDSGDIVGIQLFSSPYTTNSNSQNACSVLGLGTQQTAVCTLLPLSQAQPSLVQNAINNLTYAGGNTHMRDAFIFTQSLLSGRVNSSHKWYLVFVSDGVPEPLPGFAGSPPCIHYQDPTLCTDITQQVKNLGVTIITVGIGLGAPEYDQTLMRKIASTNQSGQPLFFEANTTTIQGIMDQIKNTVCS